MKKKFRVLLLACLASPVIASSAYAIGYIGNAGFENHTVLADWAIKDIGGGSAGVVSSATLPINPTPKTETFTAVEGSYMAKLIGTSYISQVISWQTGDTISFSWNYYTPDPNTGDTSIFSIKSGGEAIFAHTVKDHKKATGWNSFSYTFEGDGSGEVQFGAYNANTGTQAIQRPILLIDNIRTTSAVPIPSSALLLGSGVIGLLGIGSRKKKVQA